MKSARSTTPDAPTHESAVGETDLSWKRPPWEGRGKAARHDLITGGSLFLLAMICLTQMFAIGMVFWSRAHFGSNFDPKIFTDYQTILSSQSVSDTLGLEEAQKARDRMRAPVHDHVTVMLKQADEELEQSRVKQSETRIIEGQSEKQAEEWVRLAEESWKKGALDEAIRHLRTALQKTTDYLPALRTLAARLEERGEFEQACFQWEKIAGIALPESADMKEALDHLQRLASTPVPRDQTSGTFAASQTPLPRIMAAPQTPPQVLSLVEVRQTDLTLQDLYDLRFNLRFVLEAHLAASIDNTRTKLEVTFYDQSLSAGAELKPLKILSTILQPRQAWNAGDRQVLSLNYTIPKGYFRHKIKRLHDSGYRYCGFVARLFYQDQLQDSHAQPADILGVFAHGGFPSESGQKP